MNTFKLDSLDKKILYHLDHDGRASFSELAKKLKHGRDTIEYRVNRFIEKKIITKFQVVVNPYAIGKTIYKTYLKLASDKPQIQNFISRLKNHPRVFWIVQCDGQWDLIFSIAAFSAFEFNQIQTELLNSIRKILVESQIYIPFEFKEYRLKYLQNAGTHYFKIGGSPSFRQLDKIELDLLNLLSQNGRETISELARKLSLTNSLVKRRMDTLEEDGVIIGYQASIEVEKLGLTQFKTQLFLNYRSLSEEEELEEYCNKHPKIICFIKQIGDCNLELEIHAESYTEYLDIINQTRAKFKNLIRNTTTILMHTDYIKWAV
jgi:Lrp/AsnC family transcriptional regulator for asnA, asnC and gidA